MIIAVDIDQFLLVTGICSYTIASNYNLIAITEFYNKSKMCSFTKIPKEVFNIVTLTNLSFSNIKVEIIPKIIMNIIRLKRLYLNCSDTRIFDLNVTKSILSKIEVGSNKILLKKLDNSPYNSLGERVRV